MSHTKKVLTEAELLRELSSYSAHADELITPSLKEVGIIEPLEKLQGSVISYFGPFDPADDENWESLN